MQGMDENQRMLAVSGMVFGALVESFNKTIKELRRHAGSEFNEYLDALEAATIRSVENAPLDRVSEDLQLSIVEDARSLIIAVFADARVV